MSRILVIKLGAAGDVVRTTPILHLMGADDVVWITAPENAPLLTGTSARVLTHPADVAAAGPYDLVLSLEEEHQPLSAIFSALDFQQVIGAYPTKSGAVGYTAELCDWFDMSLISTFGVAEANRLKLANRRSYQEILFAALGASFSDEEYILPCVSSTNLIGDFALAASSGARWPNKQWGHWETLARRLKAFGTVNFLPRRDTLLEHLGDVANHRIVIAPDSLPLHVAIGLKKPSIGIFNCTSPWEIHGYARMVPMVSPCLDKYYYADKYKVDATLCLSPDEVYKVIEAEFGMLFGWQRQGNR